MEVYLDNSATTRPYEEVAKTVYDIMLSSYGNPSSLHRMGKRAEDLLTECREKISSTVYGTPSELYFTSGGTEADNLALIGYALSNKRRGNRIISQRTEHAAVLETLGFLEKNGFEIVYIDLLSDGTPDLESLEKEAQKGAILMSFMYVNNETGAILPIDKISQIAKKNNCALHIDAVQAYGKMPINVKEMGADMLSLSAHKIHGPNGVGALYVKKGTKINPVLFGGKQENGLRSGTENLASIAGFAKACEIKFASFDKDIKLMSSLKDELLKKLTESIEGIALNSPKNSVCSILNISFVGVKSEVLLHVLEANGIYVSSGSACNSKKNKFSYVLREMKFSNDISDSAIRFSFSPFNTIDEIDYVASVLSREIPILRKIMK